MVKYLTNNITKMSSYILSTFGLALIIFACLIAMRYRFIDTPLRQGVYGLPVIIAGLYAIRRWFMKNETHIIIPLYKAYFFPLFSLYTFLCGISLIFWLVNGSISLRFLEEVLFLLMPLIATMAVFLLYPGRDSLQWIRLLFWGMTFAYLIEINFQVFTGIDDVTFALLRSGLMASTGIRTESVLAFTFGLFVIVFTKHRDYTYVVLAFLLFFIAYKRVALFALGTTMLAVPILWLLFRIQLTKKILPILAIVTNLIAVILVIQLGLGLFDNTVSDTLGVENDELTMGRRNLYADIINYFHIDERIPLIGNGLGSVTTYLIATEADLVNPHSDILKGIIELGVIGFSIWIGMQYNRQLLSFLSFLLLIYLNLTWLSDNTFIYFEVMFVFYFLSALTILQTILPDDEEIMPDADFTDT